MPERIKRAHIPMTIRRRVWSMPCAVCGVPYDIKCDHIKPVRLGGGSEEDNIQPLCHSCNHAKTFRLSNAELVVVVRGRGLEHFRSAVYRHDTRYENPYGGTTVERWEATNPERLAFAVSLYMSFLGRHA